MKKFGKMSFIYEFSISKLNNMEIFIKIWKNFFESFFKLFLTNWGKNEDEGEKIWENKFDFWILHIKIRLYGNFDVNLLTRSFDPFLGHFSLIEAKIKVKMKEYGKMSSIFELSISKLGYMAILMQICEQNVLINF